MAYRGEAYGAWTWPAAASLAARCAVAALWAVHQTRGLPTIGLPWPWLVAAVAAGGLVAGIADAGMRGRAMGRGAMTVPGEQSASTVLLSGLRLAFAVPALVFLLTGLGLRVAGHV